MEWAFSATSFNPKTIPTRSFSILDKPKPVALPISNRKIQVTETKPTPTPASNVEVPIHICPTKHLLEPQLQKPVETTIALSSTIKPVKEYSLDPDKIPTTTPSDKSLVITGNKKAKRIRASTRIIPESDTQIDLLKLIKASDHPSKKRRKSIKK